MHSTGTYFLEVYLNIICVLQFLTIINHLCISTTKALFLDTDEKGLFELVNKLQSAVVKVLDKEPCQRCQDFHISLSKTVVLKYHLITPFTTSLQKVLIGSKRYFIVLYFKINHILNYYLLLLFIVIIISVLTYLLIL